MNVEMKWPRRCANTPGPGAGDRSPMRPARYPAKGRACMASVGLLGSPELDGGLIDER